MGEPKNEPNLNQKPETESERPEYNFEEGVEQAMRAIEQLLQNQDVVVVGIAGPDGADVGVGKSTLKAGFGANKAVVIFGALGSGADDFTPAQVEQYREMQDTLLHNSTTESGLPLNKIDVRIFIYRADQTGPDTKSPVADITIKNQHAKSGQQ